MLDLEIRRNSTPVEFRKAENGPGVLMGYAAVFNRFSQNLGGFVEQVDPTAFNKSLADNVPVVARYNHDDAYLLGTTESGSLALEVDGTGLRYEVVLPPTTAGRDIAILAERGDVRFSSFAFRTIEDDWDVTEQGFPLRTLRSVQLVDVAPVNSPAYRDTSVGMRSLAAHLHVDLETVKRATTEDLRSLISGAHTPLLGAETRGDEDGDGNEGQSDTHPGQTDLQRRIGNILLLEP